MGRSPLKEDFEDTVVVIGNCFGDDCNFTEGAACALYETTRRRFRGGRLPFNDSSIFSGFLNGVDE